MPKNPTAVTISEETVEIGAYRVAEIDAQLEALKGTMAERDKRAIASWEATEAGTALDDFLGTTLDETATLAEVRQHLVNALAAMDEHRDECVRAWHLVNTADAPASRDALLEERAEVVKRTEAIAGVLGIAAPEFAKAPGKRSTSGTTRAVKVSGARYWSQLPTEAERKFQTDSTNSLSTLSFHRGKALTDTPREKGDNNAVPVEQLKQAIVNAGGTPDAATEWECTLPNGSKVGMVVETAD